MTATRKPRSASSLTRRSFLQSAAAAGAAHLFLPRIGRGQTAIHNTVRHLLYIRLSGGFRFPTAFNSAVGEQFNPFGVASGVPSGVDWGVGALLANAPYLNGDAGQALQSRGMLPVHQLANQISVIPCVDHEPTAAGADGNHGSGLERYYTGYADGDVGFFSMINYGLRARVAEATGEGELLLPAFVLGGSGMGRGTGIYAAYRPPVLSGTGFDDFGLADKGVPSWADGLVSGADTDYQSRRHLDLQSQVQAYTETRRATAAYSDIFNSETLKIGNRSDEAVDGISNAELQTIFGDDGAARNIRLALRLFHFGSPAVYLDQGGYDLHSGEQNGLPGRIAQLNRLISGLFVALQSMTHPSGGTYFDHTLVVLGSEFSRTARGNRFNSAQGSDHNADRATRYMSMPFFGGGVQGGRSLGGTAPTDLAPTGQVYSYRSVLKTLMDALGCDHQEFFPADQPFADLFV